MSGKGIGGGLKQAGRMALRRWGMAVTLVGALLVGCAQDGASAGEDWHTSSPPGLSGLAWVRDDLFVGVHDSKDEGLPRISLVRLPRSKTERGVWRPLRVSSPGSGGSIRDLESVSRIPGGRGFMFAESGQKKGKKRIFFGELRDEVMTVDAWLDWPVPVKNVEAAEICRVGPHLVFLYAERAKGQTATLIRWATLTLNPPRFGIFAEVVYAGIDPVGPGARPISALTVDGDGVLYSAACHDSGEDDGPFRSVVWRIGRIAADAKGNPLVELGEPVRLATLDGLKVESLAIRESEATGRQLFIGTDDENHGGVIRLLPPVP